MAGLAEDGGREGRLKMGFGRDTVRREDDHDLHLRPLVASEVCLWSW